MSFLAIDTLKALVTSAMLGFPPSLRWITCLQTAEWYSLLRCRILGMLLWVPLGISRINAVGFIESQNIFLMHSILYLRFVFLDPCHGQHPSVTINSPHSNIDQIKTNRSSYLA